MDCMSPYGVKEINLTSLCRICLREGATTPIFGGVTNEISICSKLLECLKEKIEDIEGYPRNICYTCNDKLHTVYDFMIRLRHSHKILEGRLQNLKQESKNDIIELETKIFTETSEDTSNILQSEIETFKTESMDAFEISDNNSDCDKTAIYDSEIDNCNIESNVEEKQNQCSIEKAPANILGTLSHITVKKIKVEKSSEDKKNKSDDGHKKVEAKKNNTQPGVTLKTDNNSAKKHTNGQTSNREFCKEQLLRLKQQLEEKRKKLIKKNQKSRLCDLCGDIYSSSEQLTKHKLQVHAERKFKCTQCPKNYKLERELKEHISRHENIRNFICDACDRAFFTKRLVKQHIEALHSKKRCKKTSSKKRQT